MPELTTQQIMMLCWMYLIMFIWIGMAIMIYKQEQKEKAENEKRTGRGSDNPS